MFSINKGISMNEYQNTSRGTFKEHSPLTAHEAALLDWTVGLGGEVGEVQELMKHHIFHKEPLDKMKLAKEIGDVLWYVAALCSESNIDMNDMALLNINKLHHRHGGASFDGNRSANRHEIEAKFEDTKVYKQIYRRLTGDYSNVLNTKFNIVIVGPDGVGKTTLARDLAEVTGLEYYKGTYAEDDKVALGTKLFSDGVKRIYDRFYFPDEIIYRVIKDNPLSTEELGKFHELRDLMFTQDTLILYLSTSFETLASRLTDRGDEFIQISEMQKIMHEYELFYNDMHNSAHLMPVVKLNVGNASPKEVLNMVIDILVVYEENLINRRNVSNE